jgi:hypothetical protein
MLENNNVIIGNFVFHKSFVNTYKGMTKIQARRKLKEYYTRSAQNRIIHYLSENRILISKTLNYTKSTSESSSELNH